MFGIPLPWLIIGLSVALFGTYRGGYHYGWVDRDVEMQAEIAKKNEEAREVERNMTSKLNNTATQLQEANNVVAEKQTALDRAIRSGRMRLPTASCVQTPASTSPSSGNSNQAGSQSDRPADQPSDAERETLQLIAQIAADGDKAINQLNACIDSYNEVRNLINGKQ